MNAKESGFNLLTSDSSFSSSVFHFFFVELLLDEELFFHLFLSFLEVGLLVFDDFVPSLLFFFLLLGHDIRVHEVVVALVHGILQVCHASLSVAHHLSNGVRLVAFVIFAW